MYKIVFDILSQHAHFTFFVLLLYHLITLAKINWLKDNAQVPCQNRRWECISFFLLTGAR